jgi:hypothetical protein
VNKNWKEHIETKRAEQKLVSYGRPPQVPEANLYRAGEIPVHSINKKAWLTADHSIFTRHADLQEVPRNQALGCAVQYSTVLWSEYCIVSAGTTLEHLTSSAAEQHERHASRPHRFASISEPSHSLKGRFSFRSCAAICMFSHRQSLRPALLCRFCHARCHCNHKQCEVMQ